MQVRKDDDMPDRMKRGNEENPERVPTEGHEGATRVPDEEWKAVDRRKGHAREMVGKDETSDHSAGGEGLSG